MKKDDGHTVTTSPVCVHLISISVTFHQTYQNFRVDALK
jgi:hypothetical protein